MTEEEVEALVSDLAEHKILSATRRMRGKDREEVIDAVVARCLALSRNSSEADSKRANDALIAFTHSGIEPREIVERATRQGT